MRVVARWRSYGCISTNAASLVLQVFLRRRFPQAPVQAAPAVLAKTATAVTAMASATVSGSTLTIIKGALKVMKTRTKAKTAIVAGIVVFFAFQTTLSIKEIQGHRSEVWRKRFDTSVLDKVPRQSVKFLRLPCQPKIYMVGMNTRHASRPQSTHIRNRFAAYNDLGIDPAISRARMIFACRFQMGPTSFRMFRKVSGKRCNRKSKKIRFCGQNANRLRRMFWC